MIYIIFNKVIYMVRGGGRWNGHTALNTQFRELPVVLRKDHRAERILGMLVVFCLKQPKSSSIRIN